MFQKDLQYIRDKGEITVKWMPIMNRYGGDTVADHGVISLLMGKAYLKESEIDDLLYKAGEQGLGVTTLLDNPLTDHWSNYWAKSFTTNDGQTAKLIGYFQDIAGYYQVGNEVHAYKQKLGSWSNKGDVTEFKQKLVEGKWRGKLI